MLNEKMFTDLGVKILPVAGWEDFNAPGEFAPVGIVVHHTAGVNSLSTMINGRNDVPGPLGNLLINKDGSVHLISAGRANDTGNGSGIVLQDVQNDVSPTGDAIDRNLQDTNGGNKWFYDIEVENLGNNTDVYPEAQYEALIRCLIAICKANGWSEKRIIGHREWTRRKVDPTLSMDEIRADVKAEFNNVGRKYNMLMYLKEGTGPYADPSWYDYKSATTAWRRHGAGIVLTTDLKEVEAAIKRGEPVVTIGGPAAKTIHGSKVKVSDKPYLIDNLHPVVAGADRKQTRTIAKALAAAGWKVT